MTKKCANLIILGLTISCLTMAAAVLPPSVLAGSPTPEQEMQTLLQSLRDQAKTLKADLAAGRTITDDRFRTFSALIAQIKAAHQALTEQFDQRAATVQSLGGVAVDRQAVMLAAYQRIVPELLSLTACTIQKLIRGKNLAGQGFRQKIRTKFHPFLKTGARRREDFLIFFGLFRLTHQVV